MAPRAILKKSLKNTLKADIMRTLQFGKKNTSLTYFLAGALGKLACMSMSLLRGGGENGEGALLLIFQRSEGSWHGLAFNLITSIWELETELSSDQFGLCSQTLAQNNKSWGVVYW